MTATKAQIGSLLDDLYIELLDLIEQQTQCRINIERVMNGGQLLLAKTRYVQGSQTVSVAQIPTENSANFKALRNVREQPNEDRVSAVEYVLHSHPVDKMNGYCEPLNWFGVLTPSSLRSASEQFKKCIPLVIESANLQREIVAVMESIESLKKILKQNEKSDK